MAEPRRVELMTVAGNDQPKEKEKSNLSVRFSLPLSESTDKNCPEFSYVELLKNSLEDEEDDLDADDPFAAIERAEERKMLNLAKNLEQKYAPKPPPGSMGKKKKKKRFDRAEDMVDLGDGYDDTDPFVDNSEAYDELVPACMTTRHGGFYINSGRLDFKYYSDVDSDDDFAIPHKKKKKKKRLEGELDRKELIKKKRKKLSSSDAGDRSPKKKKYDKEKFKVKKTFNDISGEAVTTTTTTTSHQNGLASSPAPKPSSASFVDTVASDNLYDSGSNSQSRPALFMKPESTNSDVGGIQLESSEEGHSQSPHPETAPELPDHLPEHLVNTVLKIKQAAKESKEGKCKFFSGRVNDMLLDIEMQCRKMSTRTRLLIFSHLSSFLPCGKETLLKRAKKLRLGQQDDKLKDPMDKLKEAVNNAMGPMLERYQAECAAAAQARQDRNQDDKVRPDGASSESEEENGEKGEKKKRIMGPRKKFQWTSEIRSLVCDIVRIKMEMYEVSKVRSQTPEEYLRAFLDAEIKPMWPQGWIQTRMIFKESRAVHAKWTVALPKPKKNVFIAKSTGGPMGIMSVGHTPSSTINSSALSSTGVTPATAEIRPTEKALPRSLGASPVFMGSTVAKKVTQDDSLAGKGSGLTLLDFAEDKTYPSYMDSKQSSSSSKAGVVAADSSSASIKRITPSSVKDLSTSLLASHLTGDANYVSLGMAATEALKSISALATQDKAGPLALTSKKSPSKDKPASDFIGNFRQFISSGASSSTPVSSQTGSKSVELSHRPAGDSVRAAVYQSRSPAVDSSGGASKSASVLPSSQSQISQPAKMPRPATLDFPASNEASRRAADTSSVSQSKSSSGKTGFVTPGTVSPYTSHENVDVNSLISYISSSIQNTNPSLVKPQSSVSSSGHTAKSVGSNPAKATGSAAGRATNSASQGSVSSSSDIRKAASTDGNVNRQVTNRVSPPSASGVHRVVIPGVKSQGVTQGQAGSSSMIGATGSRSSQGTPATGSRPTTQSAAISGTRPVTSSVSGSRQVSSVGSSRASSTSPGSSMHYKMQQQAADSTKQTVHHSMAATSQRQTNTNSNKSATSNTPPKPAQTVSKSLLTTTVTSSAGPGQTTKSPVVHYQQGTVKKDPVRVSGHSLSSSQSVHSSKSTSQTMHTSKSSHITHSPKTVQPQAQKHATQSMHAPKSVPTQKKPTTPQLSPQSQATFGGLTMSQLHAQTLDASQKFRHQSSHRAPDITSQTPTSSALWRTSDQVGSSGVMLPGSSPYNHHQQPQRHRTSSESESCLYSQPAGGARGYQSMHLSEQQSPPSIPAMSLASLPRTPEHLLTSTNLFSHTSPQSSGHLGLRSPLDGHSPQSLYSTMHPSPTHSLPQSPHGYGHPFTEHSSSQHRY